MTQSKVFETGYLWEQEKPAKAIVSRRSMRRAEIFLQALEPAQGDACPKYPHG
jgi:hypothetical protein